jgi:hypothetical protein
MRISGHDLNRFSEQQGMKFVPFEMRDWKVVLTKIYTKYVALSGFAWLL